AFRLKQAGFTAQVYEASARVGGRMLSTREGLADGQVVDLGGELVDSTYSKLRSLAQELAVPIDDRYAAPFGDLTYRFDGRDLSEADLGRELASLVPKIAAALRAVEADQAEYARVDRMTMAEWLDAQPEATPLAKK